AVVVDHGQRDVVDLIGGCGRSFGPLLGGLIGGLVDLGAGGERDGGGRVGLSSGLAGVGAACGGERQCCDGGKCGEGLAHGGGGPFDTSEAVLAILAQRIHVACGCFRCRHLPSSPPRFPAGNECAAADVSDLGAGVGDLLEAGQVVPVAAGRL